MAAQSLADQALESRVAALEAEVQRLKVRVAFEPTGLPWWEKIAGTFANDPIYEEAMRLGREYRESTRPRLRKLKRKPRARS